MPTTWTGADLARPGGSTVWHYRSMAGSVFVSYTHRDSDYVVQLVDLLIQDGFSIFWDKESVHDRIDTDIEAGPEECGAFVPVVSASAKSARWVRDEIALAIELGKPILPLRLDNTHFVNLVRIPYEDVRGGEMPSDKFIKRLQKAVGMSGVPLHRATAGPIPADLERALRADPGNIVDPAPSGKSTRRAGATGTIKWFNDAKGFGFISQGSASEDAFCHHSAISADGFRSLAEGQKVEFDVSKGPKGLQATNVRVV